MAINKVIVNGETKIDLTADTATEENVVKGYTFHDATGALKTGTFEGTVGNPPLYLYELNRDNIQDDYGYIDNTEFKLVIDSVEPNYNVWIYMYSSNSGRSIVEYYSSITFEGIPGGDNNFHCVVISTDPITSVSAHAESSGGY